MVKEYADFLGSQPPYDALTADELLALVSRAEVEYVPAGKTLDVAGTAPGEHLWVVRTGAGPFGGWALAPEGMSKCKPRTALTCLRACAAG